MLCYNLAWKRQHRRKDVINLQTLANLNVPLWDSHIHIFPKKVMCALYTFFYKQYQLELPFSANPETLLQHLREQGVNKAFALVYTHKPGLSRGLNKWLFNLCSAQTWLAPFGAMHPNDPDLLKVVTECLDQYRFPGIKLHCLVQQCRPDNEKLFPIYEILVKRSKGIIIHASNFPLSAEGYLGINYIANLLKHFPTLSLVVPHLGLYDLQKYRTLLEKYEGLFLDTSFVFQNQGFTPPLDEIVEMVLDYPDRFIYGSDYPFILAPPQEGIRRILELNLPRDIYRSLFYRNAAHFLGKISAQ